MDRANEINKLDKYQQVVKLLPLASLIMFTLSSVNHIIYYMMFNINITDFLKFHEYLTLFVDDIIIYAITFGYWVYLHFKTINSNGLFSVDSYAKNGVKNDDVVIKVVFYTMCSCIFALVIFIISTGSLLKLISLSYLLFMAILFTLFIFARIKNRRFPFWIYLIILFSFQFIINPIQSAFRVYYGNSLYKYEVSSKDKDLDLKNKRYIGKNEDFLFLYDIMDGTTLIVKLDAIDGFRTVK